MIVSRAPVRFSLGGGGTDLPSYAHRHGGFVVAAAVDKFIFVCVAKRFQGTIRLAYTESEIVDSVDNVAPASGGTVSKRLSARRGQRPYARD